MLPDSRIRAIVVSSTEERRAVTGLIVSTEFCNEVVPKLFLEYFTNSYLRKVADWCLDFYSKYNAAPSRHIQDIYDDNKKKLESTEAELISKLLVSLSDQYEESSLNVDYLVESTINYFRRRELEIHKNNISVLLEDGKIDEAEQEVARFQAVSLDLDDSLYINPGDVEQRKGLYEKYEAKQKDFFKMPGDLGDFIGNIKQGDVVGITAPAKKGKTVSGDSLVYMADGTTKTIKEVVERKLSNVLCFNSASMSVVNGVVSDWIFSGVKKEYKITLKNRESIKAAITHPFYTPEGWKPIGDIRAGDFVAVAKNINVGTGSLPEHIVKALAYLIADGHLKDKSIGFTKCDNVIRDDFKSCLIKMGNTYWETDNSVHPHKGAVRNLLISTGLLNHLSADKFIPECIMKADNETVALFLRTLFTCDGSIWLCNSKPCIDYCSKSKRLVQDILMCMRRFGIIWKNRTKIVNGEVYYAIELTSGKSVKAFIENIGFSFSKMDKAKEWLSLCRSKRDYISVIPYKFVREAVSSIEANGSSVKYNETFNRAYRQRRHLSVYTFEKVFGDMDILHTDIAWVQVESIEETGEYVDMYDLTVDKHHSFIANGFILHNSFLLNDFMKHLILQKRKVVKFAIEMTDIEEITRFDKMFYPTVDRHKRRAISDEYGNEIELDVESKQYMYPCFDCVLNQTGECTDRLSKVIVRDYGGTTYNYNPEHEPCTKCRDNPDENDRFVVCAYLHPITREELESSRIIKEMKKYSSMLSKYARLVVRPKYSLTYDLMMYDLDALYKKYNFIPQAILIDYIDIMLIETQYADYRVEDEKWKLMQKLASSTKCAVITPTQANKAGAESHTLRQTDQGGFYGKGRHVNLMLGINQTAEEKSQGLYRINILDGRSVQTNPEDFCIVLQDLKSGQMHLDSYWYGRNINYF